VAAVVESVKAASDIYAPLTGTVVEANSAAVNDPALINADAMGAGWLFKIKLSDAGELTDLLDENAYKRSPRETRCPCILEVPPLVQESTTLSTASFASDFTPPHLASADVGDFTSRHIGPSDGEVAAMLEVIGLPSVDALIDEALPQSIRLDRPLDLGTP
jgi:hypothetical protein